MIKIPIKFINGRIIVNPLVTAEGYRIRFKPIIFIIDTGSSRSFLSESEALRLQIPLDSLTQSEVIKMGSFKYNLFKTKPFSLYFKTENDNIHKIEIKNFSVAKSTRSTQESKTESQSFPSLLGTDFFSLNNLVLYFDPKNFSYIAVKEEG